MRIYSIRGAPSNNRKPEDSETARRRLAKMLSNPNNWFDNAERLIFAMRQLEPCIAYHWYCLTKQGTDQEKDFPVPEIECIAVHRMMAGLAIENLCKGYIVSHLSTEEKAKLEEGQLPSRLDQKHNLRRLLSQTGIRLSEAENELVTRMQDSVQWLGRYPAPKRFEHLVNEINAATDVDQINKFVCCLQTHVGASV